MAATSAADFEGKLFQVLQVGHTDWVGKTHLSLLKEAMHRLSNVRSMNCVVVWIGTMVPFFYQR